MAVTEVADYVDAPEINAENVDEYIQLFSAGRAGMVQDVFVDFSGTVLGVCICLFTLYLIRKKHTKIKNS